MCLNGKVYVVGGDGASVEQFNPQTREWSLLPPMRQSRYGCAAAILNGLLFVVGGYDGKNCLQHVEAYDPSTNTWLEITGMQKARARCAAVVVGGLLYVVGGRSNAQLHYDLEIYNPCTGSWSCSPAPGRANACVPGTKLLGCAAGAIGDKIVFAGGEHSDRKTSVIVKDAETHNVMSGEIERVKPLNFPRTKSQSAVVDGKLLVFGGCTKPGELSNIISSSSSSRSTAVGAGKSSAAAPAGACAQGCDMSGVEAFDPSSGCWQTYPALPVSRYSGCAAFVPAGLAIFRDEACQVGAVGKAKGASGIGIRQLASAVAVASSAVAVVGAYL
jgi:hypothetical protein